MWPAKIFQKIRFNVGRLFLKHLQRTPPVAASQGWYDHRKLSVYVSICFFFKSMKLYRLLLLKLKPVGIFLLEVNNGNTKNNMWNLCNVNNNDTRTTSTAISPEIIREPRKPLVFWWFKGNRNWLCSVILLLILNRFHKLLWCFHSCLWTHNYQLGTYLRKSGKGWGADLWMTWLNRSWKLQCSALYLLELPWNEKK